MDDQRTNRAGGSVKLPKLRIIAAVAAIAFFIFFMRTLVIVQYDMVLTSYGRHRMTRAEAEELAASNYRWYRFLLTKVPDSEFLPEHPEAIPRPQNDSSITTEK